MSKAAPALAGQKCPLKVIRRLQAHVDNESISHWWGIILYRNDVHGLLDASDRLKQGCGDIAS